jgi:hypothetical protein
MIDFQSLLTGVAEPLLINQKSTTGMSSPGGEETGSSEHGERHFLCCSFVGELNRRGRQSALIEACPCPSGTSENSQQHARVIHGWVHRPHQPKVPQGRQNLPKIFKPVQGCANLCKPVQGPRVRGGRLGRVKTGQNPQPCPKLPKANQTYPSPSPGRGEGYLQFKGI